MFDNKKVGEIEQYRGMKDLFNRRTIIKAVVVLLSIAVVVWGGYKALGYAREKLPQFGLQAAKTVGQTIGEEMVADELGNINVLIAGYAGEQERGGLLTDTIMLASFNPKLQTTTFLSVPRDLYVTIKTGYNNKINSLYWNKYLANDKEHDPAAMALAHKITEITGVPIQYYVFVDFDGFVELIDQLGGIEVDVPNTINDPNYPGPNNSYTTFRIDRGLQTLDGATALKYARSRKTTSDGDRSLRQQQIIEGVVKKVMASMNITKMGELRTLYDQFQDVFKTNISFKQMLGMAQYLSDGLRFFSFVYTADCNSTIFIYADPGCVLYNADRDWYNGIAVILPDGGTPSNVGYYEHMQDFAFWVVHNQEYLLEAAEITVLNGIDTDYARQQGYRIEGVATDVAIDLKMKGMNVIDIDNSEVDHELTTVYVDDPSQYEHTIEVLKAFVEINALQSGTYNPYGSGITLILGNDYLSKL